MRRYFVDSLEEDDMAYKSSQSLRHSEHSSPQLENSQCSSCDIYSQVMSQQQGFSSQPSEAPQIAQKYYTKFSSKPSLFKGKEVIAMEKHGLTRRRSFQDINEFQKQRARDKEERDLICTLVSLLKEGTDEIQQTAEKIRSELGQQLADASAKLEDAIKRVHNFLHEFRSELSCSVIDKLECKQSSEELQTKLKEKEAVLQTLREELERHRALKHDDIKGTIKEVCSVQQKDILSELKLQKETCDAHYSEQKEFFRALCKDLESHMEDAIKTQVKKIVEECRTELMKKVGNEQHGDSHSSSVYQGSASTASADLPVNNVQTTFTTSQTNPDYTLTTQHFNGPRTATGLSSNPVMNSIGTDRVLMSPGDCVVPGEEAMAFQQFGTNPVRPGTSSCLALDRSYGYHNHTEFSSPPIHPLPNASTNASSHFSRWTSKGPSPVAAVAPLVHDTTAKEQRYTTAKRHDNGLRKVRHNYQPIRRQSARLKQKNLNRKVLAGPTVYPQDTRALKSGYGDMYMRKVTSQSGVLRNPGQLQMTRAGDKGWGMDDLYHRQEDSCFPSSRSPGQRYPLSKVQSYKSDSSGVYAELSKRQRQNYSSSQQQSTICTDKGFMAGLRNETDYKSESDKSSPETALFSVAMQDAGSEDLFIDAIDDHVYTSDEDCEMRNSCAYTRSPAPSKQMDTVRDIPQGNLNTIYKNRAIKKKRTLWSSGSSQNRDLLSFLTSSIKRRANMV